MNSTLPICFSEEDIDLTSSLAEEISEFLVKRVKEAYEARVKNLPPEILESEERRMIMVAIDKQWQGHLYNMDALREGISFRAQGQKDQEYKNEAHALHHPDGPDRGRAPEPLPLGGQDRGIPQPALRRHAARRGHPGQRGHHRQFRQCLTCQGPRKPGEGNLKLNLPKRKPPSSMRKAWDETPLPLWLGQEVQGAPPRPRGLINRGFPGKISPIKSKTPLDSRPADSLRAPTQRETRKIQA